MEFGEAAVNLSVNDCSLEEAERKLDVGGCLGSEDADISRVSVYAEDSGIETALDNTDIDVEADNSALDEVDVDDKSGGEHEKLCEVKNSAVKQITKRNRHTSKAENEKAKRSRCMAELFGDKGVCGNKERGGAEYLLDNTEESQIEDETTRTMSARAETYASGNEVKTELDWLSAERTLFGPKLAQVSMEGSDIEIEVAQASTEFGDIETELVKAGIKGREVKIKIAPVSTEFSETENGMAQVSIEVSEVETGMAQVNTEVSEIETGMAQVSTEVSEIETGLAQANTVISRTETGMAQAGRGWKEAVKEMMQESGKEKNGISSPTVHRHIDHPWVSGAIVREAMYQTAKYNNTPYTCNFDRTFGVDGTDRENLEEIQLLRQTVMEAMEQIFASEHLEIFKSNYMRTVVTHFIDNIYDSRKSSKSLFRTLNGIHGVEELTWPKVLLMLTYIQALTCMVMENIQLHTISHHMKVLANVANWVLEYFTVNDVHSWIYSIGGGWEYLADKTRLPYLMPLPPTMDDQRVAAGFEAASHGDFIMASSNKYLAKCPEVYRDV